MEWSEPSRSSMERSEGRGNSWVKGASCLCWSSLKEWSEPGPRSSSMERSEGRGNSWVEGASPRLAPVLQQHKGEVGAWPQ